MRILLAEDEVALNKALSKILKHSGYTVDSVFDGKDALDYLESDIYDLAVLDVMMPITDGLTVLKTLRERKNSIPVIILTAKGETEDKISGLDLGADDYITKPFQTEELLARIRAVSRRNSALPSVNTLNYGNLTLDQKTYELKTEEKSVKLNHKEFQLMEVFMKNPTFVTSADKIMDKLWDEDSNAEPSVIWVYISGLRKKLVQIGADVTIKTSRNSGYYLEKNDD